MDESTKTRARGPKVISGPNKHSARQITLLRKQKNLTQTELAKLVNVHQGTISKWENGEDVPSGPSLMTLASVLEATPNTITGIGVPANMPEGRRVKIVGEIAAGPFVEANEFQDSFEVLVPGLPSKYDKVPLQGFRVRGESMNQLYPDGSIVYVAPINALPGWPKPGQIVMVMHHKHGITEATLKEYVVNEHGKWLYPRSNHPAHQAPIDVRKGKGDDEEVVIVGVVVAGLIIS